MPTITFTVDPATATRIASAFGFLLGLRDASGQPRAATAAEIKAWLVQQINGMVKDAEIRAALSTVIPADIVAT